MTTLGNVFFVLTCCPFLTITHREAIKIAFFRQYNRFVIQSQLHTLQTASDEERYGFDRVVQ